jgi:hypothetical protein
MSQNIDMERLETLHSLEHSFLSSLGPQCGIHSCVENCYLQVTKERIPTNRDDNVFEFLVNTGISKFKEKYGTVMIGYFRYIPI